MLQFLLINDNKETVIFDPGAQAETSAHIKEEGLKPAAIVLTHAHGDHIEPWTLRDYTISQCI